MNLERKLPEKTKRLFERYLSAMANFYGRITIDEAFGIIQFQNDASYCLDDFVAFIADKNQRCRTNTISDGRFVIMTTDDVSIDKLGEIEIILPLGDSGSIDDMLTAYGRWLTGGVSIPGNDIDRLSGFMSWLPKKTLVKCTESAGIAVQTRVETSKDEADKKENVPEGEKKPFELTGRPDLERFFRDHILDVIENEEAYNRMGISFPGATILFGPPGCGKTFAVDQLSEYLGWSRFDIEAGTVASPYIHDTSKKIAEVFAEAIKCAPSILV